jgi:hypothetical protein
MLNRRNIIQLSIWGGAFGLSEIGRTIAQERSSRPDTNRLQNGDLIWPKKPGSYVPYDQPIEPRPEVNDDEQKWNAERDRFLRQIQTKAPYFTPEAIEQLRNLSFREFYARYAGDQVADSPGVYGAGPGLYVGHVAIVEVDQLGERWMVEALFNDGVVRHTFADWLRLREGEILWHGRFRNLSSVKRAGIVQEAKKYLGRPYDFWDLDLNSDAGFYCSKLVWLSLFRSASVAADGNTNPKRHFWYSPKQLLYGPSIERLFDPGPYGSQ